jgi:hypothetical protein
MQSVSALSVSSRSESIDYQRSHPEVEKATITCPDCRTLCLSMGKIKKDWYILCRCGTYIQKCTSSDDYSD